MVEDVFEEINDLPESAIQGFLRRANVSGYVCPSCGNGTHEHGKGIESRNWKGKLRWKCFSCGKDYSNADLLAAEWNIDLRHREGKAEFARRWKGASDFSFLQRDKPKAVEVAAPMIEEKQTAPKDYSKFYQFCRENLEKHGGEIRGLPKEFLRKVGSGYLQDKDGKEWLILPYNNHQRQGMVNFAIQQSPIFQARIRRYRQNVYQRQATCV